MNNPSSKYSYNRKTRGPTINSDTQPCPQCDSPIGIMRGSVDAICKNCGFKDPCCGD